MKLIADSGSTKTAWCLLDTDGNARRIEDTLGLNPHYIDAEGIVNELKTHLLPQIKDQLESIEEFHFYGAGCSTPRDVLIVKDALMSCFPDQRVEVEHDLLGAARALCQRESGLACILGTGSNSCYYDGKNVVDNISALGFVLGDEGGGANLGRMLIRSYFYRDMPEDLRTTFQNKYQLTKEELFKNVYHRPLPNRYVAGFSRFVGEHRLHPYMNGLISQNFEGFITNHLAKYELGSKLPVHFIGSIAIAFESELRSTLNRFGMTGGNFIKNPIDGLNKFHK